MEEFTRVNRAWKKAGRKEIHPSGALSEEEYWRSGMEKADEVLSLLDEDHRGHVMEFGCGDGRVLGHLVGHVGTLYGADVNTKFLDALEERYPDVVTVEWNGKTPAPETGLDAVYSITVFIHHSWEDGAAMLKRLAEVVAQGGVVLVDIPLYEKERERSSWIDVTTWSPARFVEAASEAGLTVVHSSGNPGAFIYEAPGVNHSAMHVLVKE